ncbi:hypothetical protein KM043_014144 [Ampulex compressa]|nr:hypothetical protein KM043_014144 [Ampulex compressa]
MKRKRSRILGRRSGISFSAERTRVHFPCTHTPSAIRRPLAATTWNAIPGEGPERRTREKGQRGNHEEELEEGGPLLGPEARDREDAGFSCGGSNLINATMVETMLISDSCYYNPPFKPIVFGGRASEVVEDEEEVSAVLVSSCTGGVLRQDENYLPGQAGNCFQEKAIPVLVTP